MTTENINLANKPFGPTNGEYYNSLQATRFLITKSGLSIVSVTPIDN